jgi:hypothetical protein
MMRRLNTMDLEKQLRKRPSIPIATIQPTI